MYSAWKTTSYGLRADLSIKASGWTITAEAQGPWSRYVRGFPLMRVPASGVRQSLRPWGMDPYSISYLDIPSETFGVVFMQSRLSDDYHLNFKLLCLGTRLSRDARGAVLSGAGDHSACDNEIIISWQPIDTPTQMVLLKSIHPL